MYLKKKKNKSKWWLAAVAVILPFVYFSTSLKPWENQFRIDKPINYVLYPLQYGYHSIVTSLHDAFKTYFYLVNVSSENLELYAENKRLQALMMNYEEQKNKIIELRELLNLKSQNDFQLITAEVVSQSILQSFKSFRISKGELHGVRIGMPVINKNGVVGKILRTYSHFSDVQLITDTNFFVDGLIERSRQRVIIKGFENDKCFIQAHRQSHIKVGDTITTSGIAGDFPGGYKIGHVVQIQYDAHNPVQNIIVSPWVKTDLVSDVFVVNYYDKRSLAILDQNHNLQNRLNHAKQNQPF